MRRGKQAALHAGCEFEVSLESALFVVREAIEADANQRVGDQPFSLDRTLADFTGAERALVDAHDCRIHFLQKLEEGGVGSLRADSREFTVSAMVRNFRPCVEGYTPSDFFFVSSTGTWNKSSVKS